MEEEYGKGLKFLMWISALVLLIACANIANLVLVRGLARRAETSIRMALGAQRKRLIRQMLTESVVLSCMGGIAGVEVAYAGSKVLLAMAFRNAANLRIDASLSPVVLEFAFGLSLMAGLIFRIARSWVASNAQPAEGSNWSMGVYIEGWADPGPSGPIGASWLRVGPEFFDIVGHHVLQGRGITTQDTATSLPVAVVNQGFVRKMFPKGENPIGVHFGISGVKSSGDFEIVGVVSDVKYNDVRHPTRSMYFRPLLQVAHTEPAGDIRSLFAGAIMLQTKGSVDGLESQVRRALASIDPKLTVNRYDKFSGQISGRVNQEPLILRLTLMFGVLALVLASVGLDGVTAYTVARRTPEIGIRTAMGAERD